MSNAEESRQSDKATSASVEAWERAGVRFPLSGTIDRTPAIANIYENCQPSSYFSSICSSRSLTKDSRYYEDLSCVLELLALVHGSARSASRRTVPMRQV